MTGLLAQRAQSALDVGCGRLLNSAGRVIDAYFSELVGFPYLVGIVKCNNPFLPLVIGEVRTRARQWLSATYEKAMLRCSPSYYQPLNWD